MPDSSMRPVDTTSGYKPAGKFTSFADVYPFMLMGEASLTDLDERYAERNPCKALVTIHRFRLNIVFAGGAPNQKDDIEAFTINGVSFRGWKNAPAAPFPTWTLKRGNPTPKKNPWLPCRNIGHRTAKSTLAATW